MSERMRKLSKTSSVDTMGYVAILKSKDIKIILSTSIFTIGRDLKNHHVIPDITISDFHCRFIYDRLKNSWFLIDRSIGGTFLNDKKMFKHELCSVKSGDKIRIGSTRRHVYKFLLLQK
ncbi:uncharacterized protein LOC113386836 [Ctenocephalides felis]|uniref:uncharacterized protein LOC113386836 n=1 Tax=Ctenocephalides felis TaxID=7515 RepID=UPI000E6E1AA8|nr:uncharacterized protein LOC113386836 [Ctenocephalides felis]